MSAEPIVRGKRFLAIASAIYAALSTWMSLRSAGFLEADGVTHFLYARYAFACPAYFVDVWARPVRMLIHAVPAHYFGLHGVRAASLVCAIACAWLTYAIARQLKWRMPELAGLFVLAQPLFFLHSFSELTEVPFALLGAAAMLLLLRRNWWAFALVCGTMPASRPEGLGFALLAIILLACHRKWVWIPLVALPILIWNTAGWWLFGSDSGPWHRWLIDRLPYSDHSLYPAGPWWRFLAVLPTVVSPLIVPAVVLGTIGLFRRESTIDSPRTLRLPDAWLIALLPWGLLTVHTILHVTGRMSSSGEPRYLLTGTPFWALLAARGWTLFADRFEWRRPVRWAALASLLPIAINVGYNVAPLHEQPDTKLAHRIADWYRASPYAVSNPRVFATNPLVYYAIDRPIQEGSKPVVQKLPPGSIFFFDSLYASFNSDSDRVLSPELFDASGWRRVEMPDWYGLPGQTWIVFVTPSLASSTASSQGDASVWPDLTQFVSFRDRLATQEDVDKGHAAFVVPDAAGKPRGSPMQVAVPQYAFYNDSERHAKVPGVLVQAVNVDGFEMGALRPIDGSGFTIASMAEFILIGTQPPR